MIEHTFAPVEVADGIVRVTYPMPMKPGHVHGYLMTTGEGYLLVDTGLGLPEMAEHWAALAPRLERPVAEILVTHFHPDHVGGTGDAVEATGASVLQGTLDHYQCEKVWGSDAWVPQLADWFARQGVPPDQTTELLEVGSVYRRFVHFVPEARLLREGDEVAGWRVVEFPGHADGHICLLKDGVLIAGDHLLPRITPAVGLYPDSRPDPLGDFLSSLRRVAELAPALALPGHGEPIAHPAGRAREIIEHHRERLDETEAALRDGPRSGYELSCVLFPGDLGAAQRRFAVAEALSHAERLVIEGRAARASDDGYVTYTQP
ncbi:MAG TPA: MBL fold metallo-hydrolase [Gaiellaceae bacterium]|jgi:glyoxylase-like metal-dependent hydrolase (beta-lactamase superfamily II)